MIGWAAYAALWVLAFLCALAYAVGVFVLQVRGVILARGVLVYPVMIAGIAAAVSRGLLTSGRTPTAADYLVPGLFLVATTFIAVFARADHNWQQRR